jgi:hypothetical protein
MVHSIRKQQRDKDERDLTAVQPFDMSFDSPHSFLERLTLSPNWTLAKMGLLAILLNIALLPPHCIHVNL